MEERDYWLCFSAFSGVGPVKFKLLLDNFGSAKEAWQVSEKDLIKIGFGQILSRKFGDFRSSFSIDKYLENIKTKKISFLISKDPEYPKLLKQIKNPPFVLYFKGGDNKSLRSLRQFDDSSNAVPPSRLSVGLGIRSPSATLVKNASHVKAPRDLEDTDKQNLMFSRIINNDEKIIAVVGTRKITEYGREVTSLLASELVSAGFTIVSGLAMGVDAVAHKTAIENGEKTIAVLGSGVDLCYPSANRNIYNSIVSGAGTVVSEFPPGQVPSRGSFPSRNRIIAGLSMGVLVTEGAEDSGALITADYAIKNGRKVFAVPGPITSSLSKGPYKLISKGAKLVTNINDILNELGIAGDKSIKGIKSNTKRGETEEENKILKILENEAMDFDQIVRMTKMDSSKLGSILSIMEIKGLIKSLESGFFSAVQ